METSIVITKNGPNQITLEELKKIPTPLYSKLELNDILDNIPAEQVLNTLFEIKSKLLPDAVISIQAYDLYELAFAIVNDQIQTIDFNKLIQDKKQILSIPDLKFLFTKLGFKILKCDIDSNRYYIEAKNNG